tara:strand:- start:10206 stop:11138 length:933 start_codon:yes stop_codon:yes gene_type:complete
MEGDTTPTFLGLDEESEGPWDVVFIPIPFEMTTSWGEGTEHGPMATIEASSQVELYDPLLKDELPCGMRFHTAKPWSSKAGTLNEQLESISEFLKSWIVSDTFPVILGGEHGILPPIVNALTDHSCISGDLSKLTIIQIDAHADLRDSLNGEKFSHGTAARRSLDAGIGNLIQIGIRALSLEESKLIEMDDRIDTFYARDLFNPINGKMEWDNLIKEIKKLSGPVWITFDVDGLDGSLVPDTGTPVPGGLTHWGAVEIIERIFSSEANVIGADINEIVPGSDRLTQFNAALIATKITSCHIANLLDKKGE